MKVTLFKWCFNHVDIVMVTLQYGIQFGFVQIILIFQKAEILSLVNHFEIVKFKG